MRKMVYRSRGNLPVVLPQRGLGRLVPLERHRLSPEVEICADMPMYEKE